TYNRRRGTESEKMFLRAADLFERGRSPMADVALYYAAQAAVYQNHTTEAHDTLTHLLARIDRTRYRALAANIEWELAVAANISGDWGTAIREAGSAAAGFTALGERANAATVDQIAIYALDRMGEQELAWRRRVRALASLDTDHRIGVLWGAATI